jgi:hypothetical protein
VPASVPRAVLTSTQGRAAAPTLRETTTLSQYWALC